MLGGGGIVCLIAVGSGGGILWGYEMSARKAKEKDETGKEKEGMLM